MPKFKLNLQRYTTAIQSGELTRRIGRVSQFFGLVVEAAAGADEVLLEGAT